MFISWTNDSLFYIELLTIQEYFSCRSDKKLEKNEKNI